MGTLFVNHLHLGSASSYRQSGFAKYLGRAHRPAELISLPHYRPESPGSAGDATEGFSRARTWHEPLPVRFPSNLRMLAEASSGSDVVHINRANPYTASLAIAARSSMKALVVDMEDLDGIGGYASYAGRYGAAGLLLTLYESLFPRTAQAVVVVSSLLHSRMERLGVPRSRLAIIPNGYDPQLFRPETSGRAAREAYGLEGYPLLVYISNFWPFERQIHRMMLESFREVLRRRPQARLAVVGRGSPLVRAMVREMRIEANVTFTGFVPRGDLPSLMAAADVAVHMISDHPFHRASSPMVVPEYMAMGKAVVAPRVGELATMLGGGAGSLVEYGDPAAMASAVLELAEDDSLRKSMGAAAMARARSTYSYEVLAKRLERVYEAAS